MKAETGAPTVRGCRSRRPFGSSTEALGPQPGRFLSDDVELHEAEARHTYRGRDQVVERLRRLLADRKDVRLTVDEGRGVAEWMYRAGGVDVPIVCVFEIDAGSVQRARLYYDPRALVSMQPKKEEG